MPVWLDGLPHPEDTAGGAVEPEFAPQLCSSLLSPQSLSPSQSQLRGMQEWSGHENSSVWQSPAKRIFLMIFRGCTPPPPLKKIIRYVKTTLHCARIALPTSRNWVHGWSETRYSAGGTCGFVTSVHTVHYPITNKIVIYTRLTVDTMKILSPTRIWKNKSEIRYIISGCYHLADYQIRQMYYFVPYRTRRQICRKVQILSASRCHPLWIPGTNFVQTTRRLLLCGRNIYQSIWLPYSVHRIYSNSHSCS